MSSVAQHRGLTRCGTVAHDSYLETSFLPGRRFDDFADLNGQLTGWLPRANNRIHATTKVRPAEALFEDPGAMLGFPPVPPDTSWRFSVRLPRALSVPDHSVSVSRR
jgi:hypothetical protein